LSGAGPRWMSLAAALLVGACGGDDDGGDGGTDVLDAEWPVPRGWSEGRRLGYALASVQTKTPTDLTAERCEIDAQLATAMTGGGLETSDSEGACIVTESVTWSGLAPDPEPTCAGIVRIAWAGDSSRVTVCGDDFPAPLSTECGRLGESPDLSVTSGPDELSGDVLGSLDATVVQSSTPTITRPEPQGMGTALWPDGPLRVEWEAQAASGIEIVVGATSGFGPRVRCLVPDDGSFTVPDRFLEPYRAGMAFVEVAALAQARPSPDGIPFRVTFRRSDAIWLFLP